MLSGPAERATRVAGLVLAAGQGRRMGRPKALVRDADGTAWVVRTARLLGRAGLAPVVVVLGAGADEVRPMLDGEPVRVVVAPDWAEGMGASLRAGLRALDPAAVHAALVCVVDTPGLDVEVVRRMTACAGPAALARATYDGRPGHPVLLGCEHFGAVAAGAGGDVGARDYLARHQAVEVECADLAPGADVDSPERLPPGHRLG